MKYFYGLIGLVLISAVFSSPALAEEMDVPWHEPSSIDAPDLSVEPPSTAFVVERGQFTNRRYGRNHGSEGVWRFHWMTPDYLGAYFGFRDISRLNHYPGIGDRTILLGATINPLGGIHLRELMPNLDLFLLTPRAHLEMGFGAVDDAVDDDDLNLTVGLGVSPVGLRATWCGSTCPFVELRAVEVTSVSIMVDYDLSFTSFGFSLGAGVGF